MLRSHGIRAVFWTGAATISATALGAAAQVGWVGTYKTKQMQLVSSKPSDNYLTVTRMSGGGYKFMFEAISAGCIGQANFDTPKLPRGSDLMLSTTDDSGGVCVMRLHREGNTIIAAEDGCEGLRGIECTFSGAYKPERHR